MTLYDLEQFVKEMRKTQDERNCFFDQAHVLEAMLFVACAHVGGLLQYPDDHSSVHDIMRLIEVHGFRRSMSTNGVEFVDRCGRPLEGMSREWLAKLLEVTAKETP